MEPVDPMVKWVTKVPMEHVAQMEKKGYRDFPVNQGNQEKMAERATLVGLEMMERQGNQAYLVNRAIEETMERWACVVDKENLEYWGNLETQEKLGFKENKEKWEAMDSLEKEVFKERMVYLEREEMMGNEVQLVSRVIEASLGPLVPQGVPEKWARWEPLADEDRRVFVDPRAR